MKPNIVVGDGTHLKSGEKIIGSCKDLAVFEFGGKNYIIVITTIENIEAAGENMTIVLVNRLIIGKDNEYILEPMERNEETEKVLVEAQRILDEDIGNIFIIEEDGKFKYYIQLDSISDDDFENIEYVFVQEIGSIDDIEIFRMEFDDDGNPQIFEIEDDEEWEVVFREFEERQYMDEEMPIQ